ncbi:hypothetical protein [Priestia megaterium]|uniref:hypothetical protein n=1 Tax=Priestia megaterium TaxID=1404 RepID=UPI0028775353|nr:hypothetical protein [Priestia megaterium]
MNDVLWKGESEQGELEIKTLGRAIQCIIATSTSRMHDGNRLKEDEQLQELMSIFGLTNEDFTYSMSPEPMDFPYKWHYVGMIK